VEADPAVLNLGGFATFYRERRPFVLEAVQIFETRSFRSVPHRRNIAPSRSSRATNLGENTTYDARFHFARTTTIAVSRWIDSDLGGPDYLDPLLDPAPDRPGTEIRAAREGAFDDGEGGPGEESAWVESIHDIDGYRHFRFRVLLVADPVGGFVPALRSIAVPFEFR